MWPYETRQENRIYLALLLRQLLIRTFILIAVCLMTLKVTPRNQDIPQEKLLVDYKRPRRDAYFPIWSMVILIVLIPLTIFWILTEDMKETIDVILTWSLSVLITALITEILKLVIGRPRPDFFYRCFPDGIMTNIDELNCTGISRDVIEGRKSFPSGHASLSFASLGVLALFLYERRILTEEGKVAQVMSYVLPLVVATAIGASRWFDNHHHWEDVLVGAVIGLSTSYITYSAGDNSACCIPCCLSETNSTASSTV